MAFSEGLWPLGAVGCTDNVMEPIEVFNHSHPPHLHMPATHERIDDPKRDSCIPVLNPQLRPCFFTFRLNDGNGRTEGFISSTCEAQTINGVQ